MCNVRLFGIVTMNSPPHTTGQNGKKDLDVKLKTVKLLEKDRGNTSMYRNRHGLDDYDSNGPRNNSKI
jgi:hypothetical protein